MCKRSSYSECSILSSYFVKDKRTTVDVCKLTEIPLSFRQTRHRLPSPLEDDKFLKYLSLVPLQSPFNAIPGDASVSHPASMSIRTPIDVWQTTPCCDDSPDNRNKSSSHKAPENRGTVTKTPQSSGFFFISQNTRNLLSSYISIL